MPHARPAHADDLLEITTRNRIARHIIEGFSLAFPTLTDFWRQIDGALADTLALAGEISPPPRRTGQTRASTAPTSPPPAAPPSPPTATANPTRLSYLRDELHAQGFGRPRGRRMTSPRRMRRTARQMRRYGMQPMIVMNAGDPLPDLDHRHPRPLALALPLRTRPAHRRRPDLARRLGAARHPHRVVAVPWPAPPRRLAVVGLAGERLGLATRAERALRHGRHRGRGRMAGRRHRARPGARATARASSSSAHCVLAVPWWAHRRRRARVRVERTPRRLARDRPRGRPGRITGHVRRGRRVGLAGPVRAWPAARPSPT